MKNFKPGSGILLLLLLFCVVGSCVRKEADAHVTADFTYEVIDNDYSIPVKINFINKSQGAQLYSWTFEGGNPATYDKKDPGIIIFNKAATITVKLTAWNDYDKQEKEITILLDSVVHADFKAEPVINNFGKTTFKISNLSSGTAQYEWLFTGGAPATSTDISPEVTFDNPGTYKLFLKAINHRGEADTISKTIQVLPALDSADFSIVPSFDDDDYEAPLTATLLNKTKSATTHQWSSSGGTIDHPTDSIPTISFSSPGTYTVTYLAANGKQQQTVSHQIIVKPNSGLRSFKDVHLGINTAHNTVGSYFSTRLRRNFTGLDTINNEVGGKIDIVYFGLNSLFDYNQFVSPQKTTTWALPAIPAARQTNYINNLATCKCGINFTEDYFKSITKGNMLDVVQMSSNQVDDPQFALPALPHIVLFINADNKKGAIIIKQVVKDNDNSYIICDIKVQKD